MNMNIEFESCVFVRPRDVESLEETINLDTNVNDKPIFVKFSSFPSVIEKILDETYVNELLHTDDDFIEILLHVQSGETNEEKLTKLNETYGKIRKSILISFESRDNESCLLLWKNKEIDKFLQLKLNFDKDTRNLNELILLTRKFIKKSLAEDHLGLAEKLIEDDRWKHAKLEITQLTDLRGYNLLMFAAEVNAISLINYLLKIGFSVNDRVNKDTSADIAWRNQNYNLLLILLNHNSCYPNGLDEYNGTMEELPQSLTNFIKFTINFFAAVDSENEVEVKNLIQQHPNLRHFYSVINISAPKFVLIHKKLQMYEFLMNHNISFGPFEPITKTIGNLSDVEREKLRKIHFNHMKELPEQHINLLVANTNLGHDMDKIDEKRNYIEKAYYLLNSILPLQIILRCVAASKKFRIIFDFNRDNVQFLEPTMDADSDGLFDSSIGRLYIGAKNIFNTKTENEVYGTIIHELCHYAMMLVYNNNGKPYHRNDENSKVQFERILKQCERRSKNEVWVDAVFEYYDEFMWVAELIVRVPHLTALYHNKPEKLEESRKNFKSLFDYYENKVVKDMEKALPRIGVKEEAKHQARKKENWILRVAVILFIILLPLAITMVYLNVRQLPEQNYGWVNLTKTQQNEIINSKFNFQGQFVKISNLTTDENVFNTLNSQSIRNFLLENESIKIDKEVDSKKRFYIERKFIKRSEKNENKTIKFSDISNEIAENNNFDAFILSDEAGTGKSTTMMNLTENLKSKFHNNWISCLFLKDHVDEFKNDAITQPLVEFLGRKILKLNDFNYTIFKTLFNENKTIILWDGFDEISPKYENFVLNLLTDVKSNTKNIQFVSTRTLYTEKLENILKIDAHKFVPYTVDDREDFLIAYAEENDFTIREAIKSQSYLERFLEKVEDSDKTHDINNPLMLQIFLETAKDRFAQRLNDTSINFFSLYQNFIERKYDIFYDKSSDRSEIFRLKENAKRNHQILALNMIFKDITIHDIQTNEAYNVSSLDIMRNIDGISIDELSRIGIIDVFKNPFTNESEYNFGHRTFAEFFVSQYLIESFYKVEYVPRDAELNLRLKLLFNVLTDANFKIIQQFLYDYISDAHRHGKLNENPSKIYGDVIERDFRNVFDFMFLIDESLTLVDRVSNFFQNDGKILNLFWRLNGNETYFIWHFKETSNDNFIEAHTMAMKYFPNAADQQKLFFGENQIGNIIFTLWLHRDDDKLKSWNEFYTKNLPEDVRLKNLQNMNIFKILSTDENDKREILLRNSYKILHLLYFSDVKDSPEVNIELSKLNNTLTHDEIRKYLIGNNWKKNNTILHKISKDGNMKILNDFISRAEMFLTKNDITSLVSWQNRINLETPLALASKYQEISFVQKSWEFLYQNLNSDSLKNIFKLKTLDDELILLTSMKNEHKNVFSYIKGLYEYYFDTNETRNCFEQTKNNSLNFLLDENTKLDDKDFGLLTEYLERTFNENQHHLRRLFASNDEDFMKSFKKVLNSNKNLKVSSLISLLIKTLTVEEKKQISLEQNQKVENFVDQKIENTSFMNSSIDKKVKDFFNQRMNIFNDSQVSFKMLANDEKFYEILINDFNSEKCVKQQNNCQELNSVYSAFDISLNEIFQAKFKSKYSQEASEVFQLIALDELIQSDYVEAMLSKVVLFLYVTKVDLLNVNANNAYSFVYKPYRDFLAAQYLIERLYKNGSSSNDLNLLIDIWSLKCDCREVSNLIVDFIENENIKSSFSDDFKNLIHKNHSDLLLNIDISSINVASKFFAKDEEMLRKLWMIDENETLYYCFVKNNRLNELDYLDSVARKYFNSSDIMKLANLNSQKGKILFYAWNNKNLTYFDLEKILNRLELSREIIKNQRFDENENFINFFNNFAKYLSVDDQKELIYVDTKRFFLNDIFEVDLNAFESFWSKIIKILSKQELNEIFLQKDDQTQSSILHNAYKIKSIEYLNSILSHLKQILTPTQFFELMKAKESFELTPLMKFISYNSKHEYIEELWHVTDELLNKTQQREILGVRKANDTALQTSFYSLPRDKEIFDFVSKLYEKFFSLSEIEDLVAHESDDKLETYLFHNTFPSIAEFFLKIFESDKKKFLYYLSRKKDELTIFERNKGIPIYQQNLKILIEYVKKNYDLNDVKSLGIE